MLPSEVVATLRDALDALIASNPNTRPEQLVSAHLTGGREGVIGSDAFMQLAKHPLLLDAVEQIIGPNICLWGCQVFCKPGLNGMEVPMHQDGNYWPIRPLATCSVWVAIDRSDSGNGCLRVVPRSHSGEPFVHQTTDSKHVVLNQYIPEDELSKMQSPVDLELDPGQFSLHDVFTVHGSDANTSPRRRAGVTLRYMPTSSLFDRHLFPVDASRGYTVDWAKRPIFLLRGQDAAGNVFDPTNTSNL